MVDEADELTPAERQYPNFTDEEIRAQVAANPDAAPILTARELKALRAAGKIRRVPAPDPAAIRAKLGMTQREFAWIYHIPFDTLREWEERGSTLNFLLRAYVAVIEREPETVRRALWPTP